MTKKIMFNDKYCLTQAVLDGTKIMTRRSFARFEPDARMFDEICNVEGGFDDKGRWIFTLYNENGDIIGDMIPRYNIGEVVAIAQPYKDIVECLPMYSDAILDEVGMPRKEFKAGWANKMFVRAELLPRHIQFTDVKAERLQDISDKDCLREGIRYYPSTDKRWANDSGYGYHIPKNGLHLFDTPYKAFANLFERISGKGTWESNPWVAAYSFELVD